MLSTTTAPTAAVPSPRLSAAMLPAWLPLREPAAIAEASLPLPAAPLAVAVTGVAKLHITLAAPAMRAITALAALRAIPVDLASAATTRLPHREIRFLDRKSTRLNSSH